MARHIPPASRLQSNRPNSAVSGGVGLAGLFGLTLWIAIARVFDMAGSWAALANILACAMPMFIWSILVDRVLLAPSTGIDWRSPRPADEIRDVSLTKLAGLWSTWALIGAGYCLFRWYWQGPFLFAMEVIQFAAPILFIASIPYTFWIDRRLREPRDGAWHLGAWLTGQAGWQVAPILEHGRGWAIKGFYLAFMLSIIPAPFEAVVRPSINALLASPVALILWLIGLMFVIDIAMATAGYLLTFRPIDAHIRSANPSVQGWVAALVCYPPFVLVGAGGVLDYRVATGGEQNWLRWLPDHPIILTVYGGFLVLLTGVYAWATMAFGLRFSNLTHRGIITHGPYRWTKHPAYLAKNLFWWFASLPFLVETGSLVDAVRNSAALMLVGALYFWRARTEERHLSQDPAYRCYAQWIRRHGLFSGIAKGTWKPAGRR